MCDIIVKRCGIVQDRDFCWFQLNCFLFSVSQRLHFGKCLLPLKTCCPRRVFSSLMHHDELDWQIWSTCAPDSLDGSEMALSSRAIEKAHWMMKYIPEVKTALGLSMFCSFALHYGAERRWLGSSIVHHLLSCCSSHQMNPPLPWLLFSQSLPIAQR